MWKNKWSKRLQKGQEDDWERRMDKMEKKKQEHKTGEGSEWWSSPFSRFEGDKLLAVRRICTGGEQLNLLSGSHKRVPELLALGI